MGDPSHTMHPLLLVPAPLHELIRSHLSPKDGLALGAASTWLLQLHRLNARWLTLRARAPPASPTALQALASLLARQEASELRQLKVRVVESSSLAAAAAAAASAAAAAAAVDDDDHGAAAAAAAPFGLPVMPPHAWPAAAGPPTGAGDVAMVISEEEEDDDGDHSGPAAAAAAALPVVLPPPPQLPPLPCLHQVERLVMEAAEEEDYDDDDNEKEGVSQRVKQDNTLHATLAAVLISPNAPTPAPSARASLASGLLGALLLAPGVLPSLRVLKLEGRDLLDEQGLELLGRALEARHQHTQTHPWPATSRLTTLALEPPSLTQGRGLARVLLSGACDSLETLSVRRVNALGMSAVARFLLSPQHSGCLRALSLYRREGHLAWADPVADALAAMGAPNLQSLHLSFLPFGSRAAESFIRCRLRVHPLRELRLTAAGLREHDLAHLLLPAPPTPTSPLPPPLSSPFPFPPTRELRVLRLDFRGAVAQVLPHALQDGACPRLEALGLVHCRLGDGGCAVLAQALAQSTPRLRSLDLAFNGVGAEGAAALALWCLGLGLGGCDKENSGGLSQLEHLRLDGNVLTDAGVLRLAQALRPRGGAATAAGGPMVAAGGGGCGFGIPDTELTHAVPSQPSPSLPASPSLRLRTLELRRVEMGKGAVRALCQALLAGGAPHLRSLVLGTPYTPGMAAADGSNGYVQAGALDDGGLQALLRAGRPKLRVRQEPGSPFQGLV